MTKILSQSQAEAVYSAMCALNNVGGRIEHMQFPTDAGESVSVVERLDGKVDVWLSRNGQAHESESHANQAAFADAYGIYQGDDDIVYDDRESYARCSD